MANFFKQRISYYPFQIISHQRSNVCPGILITFSGVKNNIFWKLPVRAIIFIMIGFET